MATAAAHSAWCTGATLGSVPSAQQRVLRLPNKHCARPARASRACTPVGSLTREPPATKFEPRTAANNVIPGPPSHSSRGHETDVVVIGSGIGGLCCAALLARYGYKVTVCEAHYLTGGAAHTFEVKGFHFDAGPSFFAGIRPTAENVSSPNPLKQVLDAVGEEVECVSYDRWTTHTPEGVYDVVCDGAKYAQMILERGGQAAHDQWLALQKQLEPLQSGASLFPAAAIRSDPGILLTAARFGPSLAKMGLMARTLTGPFSAVVDRIVTDPWLKNFMDLECFVLSGMLAKDTITAEMAFMLQERNNGASTIDYPIGGSKAIIAALTRGITKHGGRILTRAHVQDIVLEGGRATGVMLAPHGAKGRSEFIRARKAVVSNASVWDTQRLLPSWKVPQKWAKESGKTPACSSFMHLHLGIDARGLDPALEAHHLFVNQWDDLTAPQNVCIASVPTVFDPAMAPPGKAVVHAYTAGNEPYSIWEGLDRRSAEYKQLKEDRSEVLWRALERAIPDIRQRAEVTMVGTPLTHERFLRRHRGSYGPAISAASGAFPGPHTPISGLYRCGDSCAPGIGVPAAAASGMITANTLVPVWSHFKLLDALAV